MNVTIHSAFGLFDLLTASFVCGIAVSLIYITLISMSRISNTVRCKRFSSYKQFRQCFVPVRDAGIALGISDYIACLIFAFLLLGVSFIFNSGNLRLLSFAIMLLGWFVGLRTFARFLNNIVILMLFGFKWSFDLCASPFIWIINKLRCLLLNIIKKIKIVHNSKLIRKYTVYRFARIKKDTELGMLDDYYKELIK